MTDNTPPSSFFSMIKGEAEHVPSPNDTPMLNNDSNEADSLNWYVQENSAADNTSSSFSSPDSLLKTEVVNIDESDMPHDARRVLVHLLRQGSVMASQKPKVFEQLVRFEIEVRKHLSEVYLRLVLDQKTGVAFVASTSVTGSSYDAKVTGTDKNTTNPPLQPIANITNKVTTTMATNK